MNKYTGRMIAIFTDVHALLEPIKAIMDDINKQGIKEIYSLGDNIGDGPCPNEVINLLNKNNVKSVSGNAEYYITIGVEPFMSFLTPSRLSSCKWTKDKLSKSNLDIIGKYPSSIELDVGGKKIALCHFINDVRIDYTLRSTWTYQDELKCGNKAYLQFEYTNSEEQKKDILKNIKNNKPFYNGFRNAYHDPLFKCKKVSEFDYVFQGHVHYKYYEEGPKTKFYTVPMAYKEKNICTYIILKEKENGFDILEVTVYFDRDSMLNRVKNSDIPSKYIINKYIRH